MTYLRRATSSYRRKIASLDREVEYERAAISGDRWTRRTSITMKMHTVEEVAAHVFQRLRRLDEESAANQRPEVTHFLRYQIQP